MKDLAEEIFQMEFLNKILTREGIDSIEKVRSYMLNGNSTELGVLTHDDLSICAESRIYDEEVNFENKIIDVDFLWIADAKKIRFLNCIFLGKVLITKKHREKCDVYMDYCIFTEELKVSGIYRLGSICLVSVNSPIISIESNNVDSISCHTCNCSRFIVLDNHANELRTYQCSFKYPSISRNEFTRISFSHEQIDISRRKFLNEKNDHYKQDFDCFFYPEGIDFDNLSEIDSQRVRVDTLRFLLEETNISINKEAKSHVRYLELIESNRYFYEKVFVRLFGGLLKPFRLFFLMLAVMVVYAAIYQLPQLVFNAPCPDGSTDVRGLEFVEALYYSGITFTTVGYGDISPVGIGRFIAITEGVLGILLSSAFLASLIRKYTE